MTKEEYSQVADQLTAELESLRLALTAFDSPGWKELEKITLQVGEAYLGALLRAKETQQIFCLQGQILANRVLIDFPQYITNEIQDRQLKLAGVREKMKEPENG